VPSEPSCQALLPRHAVQAVGLALLGFAFSTPAQAQNAGSRLQGVWSSTLTAPEHPAWRIEDHLCGTCTPSEYRQLERLLAEPANRDRSLQELQERARATARQQIDEIVTTGARERLARIEQPADPSVVCEQPSLLIVVNNPLPLAIELRDDHVILRSQHWDVVRTVSFSEQAPVATGKPSLYGNAAARVDDATLIVESVNLLPMATPEGVTTTQAKVVERYTASADGSRLDVELAIYDAETYREPRVFYRPRLRTPEVELVADEPCANLEQ
jgi:hypothetical protein